ncbi:AraC family transcriptional regulator [Dyella telluris]|uniref:Helix-turn-helix transcriptional regulator n=1 Tax=Dyella telluris TaxID=2763498 RepID=A0A7G8Q5H6_9GAMM|nr:AraC family transcriptional regulator [Dyella telluris]QNK02034.1 helix-turn-helix transcriptional regulator [Dyella telluris]
MDGLDRLVEAIAPTGSVELQCRFAGEWSLDHPPAPPNHLPYHVILGGSAELEMDGQRTALQKGDVLLFPYGDAHIMRSRSPAGEQRRPASRETRRLRGRVTLVERSGDGEALDMLCGQFTLAGATDALWTGLPSVLHLRAGNGEALPDLVRLLRDETASAQPGGQGVIRMITGAMFTLMLRSMTGQGQWQLGILGLLANPRMAGVVDAVLKEPTHAWTLQNLAELAHTSRASFARHFSETAGVTPMDWVNGVRLGLAARSLRAGKLSAGRAAELAGYASEAAFTRAFKARYGSSPGAYGRQYVKS